MSNPINSADQIGFCNSTIRPSGDMLGKVYNAAKERQNRWNALGGGATALAQMATEIRRTADFIIGDTTGAGGMYCRCFTAELQWFLKGGTSFIPNDAAALVFDNGGGTAQDPTRPAINGANVVNLISQAIAFRQWLENGAFATGGRSGSFASLNTIMQVSSQGISVIDVSSAANFITRCGEIITDYEANSNAILNVILACAVNPVPTF